MTTQRDIATTLNAVDAEIVTHEKIGTALDAIRRRLLTLLMSENANKELSGD